MADDYRNLTGMQKAAIFMLAIGEDHSTQLLERMDDEEIRDLSKAMSSLGSVSAGVVERLFIEFSEQLSGSGGGGARLQDERIRQIVCPAHDELLGRCIRV